MHDHLVQKQVTSRLLAAAHSPKAIPDANRDPKIARRGRRLRCWKAR